MPETLNDPQPPPSPAQELVAVHAKLDALKVRMTVLLCLVAVTLGGILALMAGMLWH